jgi:hypothetical protein
MSRDNTPTRRTTATIKCYSPTPTYSSWINQVERFFAYVTADLLQRSDHRRVQTLEADIRNWVRGWNETRSHSPGPSPRNRSSSPSADFYSELPAQDTSR